MPVSVGEPVGDADPVSVGDADPVSVGEADPVSVGEPVGVSVGVSVGELSTEDATQRMSSGSHEGDADGDEVPVSVGEADPVSVGAEPVSVGDAEPVSVGETEPVSVGVADPVSVGEPVGGLSTDDAMQRMSSGSHVGDAEADDAPVSVGVELAAPEPESVAEPVTEPESVPVALAVPVSCPCSACSASVCCRIGQSPRIRPSRRRCSARIRPCRSARISCSRS